MKNLSGLLGVTIVMGMLLAACSAPAATVAVEVTNTMESLNPAESSSPASSSSSSSSSEDGIEIEMDDFAFVPAELTVKVGTKVTWTNKDSASHDVQAADGSWASDSLSKDQSFSKVFDVEGTFAYVCTFHPGMQGKIIVTK